VSDRGAKALAERLLFIFGDRNNPEKAVKDHAHVADSILGERGLFIPDVSKHEPKIVGEMSEPFNAWLECSCGQWDSETDGPYFDHLTEPAP
jgi:hypothetical protein